MLTGERLHLLGGLEEGGGVAHEALQRRAAGEIARPTAR